MSQVKLLTIGRFHHFHLARQLHKFNLLDEIYSAYPMFKLQDEHDIPRNKIKTYPYYQIPYLFFDKYLQQTSPFIFHYLATLSHKTLSLKVSKNIGNANILIASANAGLEAGKKIKSLNGKFICDRGSTHIEYQNEILKAEYNRFNIPYHAISKETLQRELEEYNEADIISVPSSYALNSFLKKGIDKKKLFLNPMGVDLQRFNPLPKKHTEIFQVIYVGTLSIKKGIFYLLEAFKKLKFKNKKLTLIGNIDHTIKDKLAKYLSNEIEYLSPIKNYLLTKYYSEANVLVQPSIDDGFSMVVAEALACACPVIATENTGATDLFKDGQEGFIIKSKSVEEIYEKLQLLADDKIMQEKMSYNAEIAVNKIGGWDQYGKNWHDKLKNISYD
jgi:glycosyltransferase involved in cell wall biosynthesis